MVRKKVFRAIVLSLCCICVLFSTIPSAGAVGIWYDNTSVPKYYSLVSGSATFKMRSDMSSDKDKAFGFKMSCDLPRIIPQMSVNGDVYLLNFGVEYYDNPIMTSGSEDTVGIAITANREDSYIDKDDYVFTRVTMDYDIRDDQSVSPYTVGVTWNLDPFSFYWDADFLHNLIRIRSFKKSDITLSGTIWYLNCINELDCYEFKLVLAGAGHNTTGTEWVQSAFTRNFCNHFVQICGLTTGDPVLFTDLQIDVDVIQPGDDTWLVIGASAIDVLTEGYVNGTPKFARDPVNWFNARVLDYVNASANPPVVDDNVAGNVFTVFLAEAVGGFFDAEIFPGFTLGGVFGVIITIILILLLLKYFAG